MPQPEANRTSRSRRMPVFEPPLDTWPAAGVYQLWLCVSVPIRLRVGALGWREFEPAMYVYTGRAARGLVARVQRHARHEKRKHWHIDYLLTNRHVRLERIHLVTTNPEMECHANQIFGTQVGWEVVPRFGSSDCELECDGHLWKNDGAGAADADGNAS